MDYQWQPDREKQFCANLLTAGPIHSEAWQRLQVLLI